MVTRSAISSGVQFVQPFQKTQRAIRAPRHQYYLKLIPFTLQPFMIAPVLPGETLKSGTVQFRAVTDPILNSIIGWWIEQYYFYVKLSDLDDRDQITNSFIDPGVTMTSLKETDDTPTQYFTPLANNELNWVEKCLKRVTEEYFRGQSETWNNITISGLPVIQINGNSWLDSFTQDDSFQTSIEPTIDTSGATVGVTAVEAAMRQWDLLRLHNMTDLTWEDYLQSFGVKVPDAEKAHRPELIRYLREWQYPSNTVDPSTGVPSSAVSWAVTDRLDKDRFFREPGFVFGVMCCRPKVYFGSQRTFAATMLDDVYSWLPAVLSDDPQTSLKQFTAGTGPLKGNTDDYWVDVADLFMYGDQYLNFDPNAATGVNQLAMPTASGQKRYITNQAMLDTLFVSANAVVKVDGVTQIHVASSLRDRS